MIVNRLPFKVEYARDTYNCNVCQKKIDKEELTIASVIQSNIYPKASKEWHHVACAFKANHPMSAADISGFPNLRFEDQQRIENNIVEANIDEFLVSTFENTTPRYPTREEDWESAPKGLKYDPRVELKSQSDKLFGFREVLEALITEDVLKTIFELNKLEISKNKDWRHQIGRLADALVFGVYDPCPQCERRSLRFKDGYYKCKTAISEYTWCGYIYPYTVEPKKSRLRVPKDLLQMFPILDGGLDKRVIPYIPVPVPQAVDPYETRRVQCSIRGKSIVIEDTKKSPGAIQMKLVRFGCKIEKKVTKRTFCVISTAANVQNMTPLMRTAKELDVIVVSENFLDQLYGDLLFNPDSCKLSTWGKEALFETLIGRAPVRRRQERPLHCNPAAAEEVPPSADDIRGRNIESHWQVYSEDKDVYSCVLGMADLSRAMNSHCRLQLVKGARDAFVVTQTNSESPDKSGILPVTTTTTKTFKVLPDAKAHFESLFLRLTGNIWSARANFAKLPDYYDLIKVGVWQDERLLTSGERIEARNLTWSEEITQGSNPDPDPVLPEAIKTLMHEIVSLTTIDLREMPLGVVTVEQLTKAYKVLMELRGLIAMRKATKLEFLDASNKFYTIIPTIFDVKSPPRLIDDVTMIKEKMDMLRRWADNLTAKKKDSAWHIYSRLNTEIQVVPLGSYDYNLIQRCIDSTVGLIDNNLAAHHRGAYNLIEVFSIKRKGEAERLEAFKRVTNRKLLWHGSSRSHLESLLTYGFRMGNNPGLFGTGLYFADSPAKSLGYCDNKSTYAMLLLCEVVLGDMHETGVALRKPPEGKDSLKGLGGIQLDHEEELHGCPLAIGPHKSTARSPSLGISFNEYIIYNASQVRIRYLVKLQPK